MTKTGKVATWLELAAAPHSRDKCLNLRVHPLLPVAAPATRNGKEKCCYAISVDGRWLHAGDGRLTVLKGMEAVDRFMGLVKMPAFEPGDPAEFELDCVNTAYCMAASRRAGLQGCV